LNLSLTLRDREDHYALFLFANNVPDKNFYIDMGDDDDDWSSPPISAPMRVTASVMPG